MNAAASYYVTPPRAGAARKDDERYDSSARCRLICVRRYAMSRAGMMTRGSREANARAMRYVECE